MQGASVRYANWVGVYAKSMGGIRKVVGFDTRGGWVCRVGVGDVQGGCGGYAGWAGGICRVGGWDMQGGWAGYSWRVGVICRMCRRAK